MAFAKIIAFDRPLAAAILPGREQPCHTAAELAAAAAAAYQRGIDDARAAADQQMVEFRADMGQLSEGVLKRLAAAEAEVVAQLHAALPALALEIARRLLAGFEPPAETVSRICEEAVAQLYPERNGLELALCPRDAGLLQQLRPAWLVQHPDLVIRADDSLRPGDCLVRSRFGLTDARQQTKLESLRHVLTGT